MVSPVTVRQWAQKGLLQASTTPGGHRRFLREDIDEFALGNGISIQPEDETLRILIVDDDEQICRQVKQAIEGINDKVELEVANSGFDAGRLVITFQPSIVLLDVIMPGLDGFTVCQQICRDPRTKHVRIIGMTDFDDNIFMKGILQAGAETCIKKPFKNQHLLTLLGLDSLAQAEQVLVD